MTGKRLKDQVDFIHFTGSLYIDLINLPSQVFSTYSVFLSSKRTDLPQLTMVTLRSASHFHYFSRE